MPKQEIILKNKFRETALAKLREAMPALEKKNFGKSLALFGSLDRIDDFHDESDIDLLVEFSGPIGIRFTYLADELESNVGYNIDLVSRKAIKSEYLKLIERELTCI